MSEEEMLKIQQQIFELKCQQQFEKKDNKKQIEQLSKKLSEICAEEKQQ